MVATVIEGVEQGKFERVLILLDAKILVFNFIVEYFRKDSIKEVNYRYYYSIAIIIMVKIIIIERREHITNFIKVIMADYMEGLNSNY